MQETLNYGLRKPDGSDFYNVEDQNYNMDVIDAELTSIDETLKMGILTESKSVYVSPSGSDETGNGTESNPWRTIQKAVDECPVCSWNGSEYYIYLTEGTYDEVVRIRQATKICIKGAITDILDDADKYKVKCIYASGELSNIELQGLYLYGDGAVYGSAGCFVGNIGFVYKCKFDNCMCRSSQTAKTLTIHSTDLSNYQGGAYKYGVIHSIGGKISCFYVTGTNNVVGYCVTASAHSGEICVSRDCTLTADTLIQEDYSGRVRFGVSGWQRIGSVTGESSVTVDINLYTEFMVCQCYTTKEIEIVHNINSNMFSTTTKGLLGGYYASATSNYGGKIRYTKIDNTGTINNDNFFVCGENQTTSTTMTVYARRA